MILRISYPCRKDLSQLMSFTFTSSRFTIIQVPGSPKHKTDQFGKPRLKLFAARIHQTLSISSEAI